MQYYWSSRESGGGDDYKHVAAHGGAFVAVPIDICASYGFFMRTCGQILL